MFAVPDNTVIDTLRRALDTHDYSTVGLTQRFGIASPPRPGDEHRLLHLTRAVTPENALVRLFLCGTSVGEQSARDALTEELVTLLLDANLLERDVDRVRSRIMIVPIEDLLFASDAYRLLGTAGAADFVLPACTHSANYLRNLTMRDRVATALDLACGCGIHALFAASHSDSVTATDISPTAIQYTTLNAQLNGIDNIECLEGSLFDPVANRSFDLIISNPPFVIGPSVSFVHRDNELELDEFCRLLIREAPGYLNDGGHLQLLCESAEFDDEPWHQRISSWFEANGCDAWILHGPPLHPTHYVSRRASDLEGGADQIADYDDWVEYFESRNVVAVHPAMVALRKREEQHWIHVHNHASDVEQYAGDAVRRSIAACDFIAQHSDDESMLNTTLRMSPELTLEETFVRVDDNWQPKNLILRTASGLAMDAEVDLPIMAFLNQIDGVRTLRRTLADFSESVGADEAKLTTELLPIVRLLIERGFLLPPGISP